MQWHHQLCRAKDPPVGGYKVPLLHKVRLACDAVSGRGGIKICFDACNGA